MLAGRYDNAAPAEPELTPGLTVTPHVTDRHAPSDVGGRLDTTKGWRLAIPDPVTASRSSRSEEHTSELQSLMRISYAVFCLKKKINTKHTDHIHRKQEP